MEPKEKKRAQFGWVMYDWANSAFVTTITAAVLPVYYSKFAASELNAKSPDSLLGVYQHDCAAAGRIAGTCPGRNGGF